MSPIFLEFKVCGTEDHEALVPDAAADIPRGSRGG